MEQFTRIQGIAAPLMRANIDTDLLIPSKEMTGSGKQGYGEKLLAPWRYLTAVQATEPSLQRIENPDFVLNRAPFRQATVLIAGANFGSGSSREQAVWAIRQFGFRCVIAPSFGTIFRNNCYRNGVLPVVLSTADVEALARNAEGGQLLLAVDLGKCAVFQSDGSSLSFSVPAAERSMMLEGLDAIDLTLKRHGQIKSFQTTDQLARPWIWERA